MALALSACGTLAPQPRPLEPALPQAGRWTLRYTGECAGREAEPLLITRLDKGALVFDDFQLERNEEGDYVGAAIFIAPMPVDGREIPYEIAYALRASAAGGFAGSETVTEGGGQSIACPIALDFSGD